MTHSPKFAAQVLNEIPELEAAKILSPEAAEALRQHYTPLLTKRHTTNAALILSAVFGALLIGAGIVLLFAHNWDELGRLARVILALTPLAGSIALTAFTLTRRPESAMWREGSAAFYFMSIGAAIALVSQTYHLYNNMEGFLFIWMILTLPLIYLLRSSAGFLAFLSCLVAYNFELTDIHHLWARARVAPNYFPFLWWFAALPFCAWRILRHRERPWTAWILFAFVLAGFLLGIPHFGRWEIECWPVLLATLFGALYLGGCHGFGKAGWGNPFRGIGSLGIATFALTMSFNVFAHELFRHNNYNYVPNWLQCGIVTVGITGYAVFLAESKRRNAQHSFNLKFDFCAALFPAVVAGTWLVGDEGFFLLLLNLYVFALGVCVLVNGVRQDSLFNMNKGAVLLALLFLFRFFDTGLDFVVRGIGCILVGAGFLGMNLWVLRKRKSAQLDAANNHN